MREAAVTVSDSGGVPDMAGAIAEVQAWMARLKDEGVFEGAGKDAGWRELADAIDAASVRPGKAATR